VRPTVKLLDAAGGEVKIEFNDTGCHQIDDFFRKAKEVHTALEDITGPIKENRDKLYESTGFYEVPGAETKHAFLGMFISFAATVNGQMDSLGAQWGGASFVGLDEAKLGSRASMFKDFTKYIKDLQKCITEQIPDLLEKAERLPSEAEDAKNSAEHELAQLDFMKKSKAIMAFGINIKNLAKVPGAIKQALEGLKSDLEEAKEAMNQVKTEWASFGQHGAGCAAAGVTDPVPCYKRIYGPIKYTMAQRKEWEESMKEIVWRKFTRHFDPMQYPLTDLIDPAAQPK